MSEVVEKPAVESANPVSSTAPAVEVYAVYGVEPEIQAYAMAKYSRSALSMKESLREISQQKAEKFLNTFYFQYGHRSIADLAHIALAIERLSILAAIAVADEQRWDGQERLHPLPGLQKERLLRPRLRRRPCGGGRLARPGVREGFLSRHGGFIIRRVRNSVGPHVPVPGQHHAQARRNEAGRLRAHPAGPRLRYLPLPVCRSRPTPRWVRSSTRARSRSQVSHLLSHTHKEIRQLGEGC